MHGLQNPAVFNGRSQNGDYPDLPADFWTVFPEGSSTETDLSSAVGPALTVPEMRPAEPQVVTWDWTVPGVDESRLGLLAVVTNIQDPVNETRRAVSEVVRTNKHVALWEVGVGRVGASTNVLLVVVIGLGVAVVAVAGVVGAVELIE